MTNQTSSVIKLEKVSKFFHYGKKKLWALNEISFEIFKGTTLGVVGESGCGKSTLGKVILKLEEATAGNIYFQGHSIKNLSSKQMQPLRRKMQMIFQDPYSSLNPRFTVEQIVSEGLDIHRLAYGAEKKAIVENLITSVGLESQALKRYPHEFSGGQKQRIGIARALALDPTLLVCDEPLSALDACTQKQVMELLLKLKKERQLTYVFISHDLHAVKMIADKIAVMYLGYIVELISANQLFSSPLHPYTQGLIHAVPEPDPIKEKAKKGLTIYGEPPSPLNPPQGCPFHPRCPFVMAICKEIAPKLQERSCGSFVACHAV